MANLIELGWSTLAIFGGGGALISAASGFASKAFAERALEKQKGEINQKIESLKGDIALKLESHKHRIRREELLFERDFAAAHDWYQMKLDIFPKDMHDPDFEEMLNNVGMAMGSISNRLYAFLQKHGPLIPAEVRREIEGYAFSSGSENYNLWDARENATTEARKIVKELHEYFPKTEIVLNDRVRESSETA